MKYHLRAAWVVSGLHSDDTEGHVWIQSVSAMRKEGLGCTVHTSCSDLWGDM